MGFVISVFQHPDCHGQVRNTCLSGREKRGRQSAVPGGRTQSFQIKYLCHTCTISYHIHKHTKPGCVPVALGSGTHPNTLADAGKVCMRV